MKMWQHFANSLELFVEIPKIKLFKTDDTEEGGTK